jgi:aromatic-L-amino-acid decarboxylase
MAGSIFTQTRIGGRIAIRFQAGQFDMTEEDADTAFEVITEIAKGLGSVA